MQRQRASQGEPRRKSTKKERAQATAREQATPREREIADAIEATRRSTRRSSAPPRSTGDLRELSESPQSSDDPHAFLDRPNSDDVLAEQLGEGFVAEATTGEYVDMNDASVPEERGGPFVVTPASIELAFDEDDSNPIDSTREPFPRSSR